MYSRSSVQSIRLPPTSMGVRYAARAPGAQRAPGLPDFWGKLAWLLIHGTILSNVGASTNAGAVHLEKSALI